MIRQRRYYSEELKLAILKQIWNRDLSKTEASQKYGILGHSTISKWEKNYHLYGQCSVPLESFQPKDLSNKKATPEDLTKLQQRIAELERQLSDEKLRSEAYNRIIDYGEKEFKLPLRKKRNTK